jgi:predicted anti-sigma-YlaC factor YlaD
MECRKIKKIIPIYLDHELSADDHRLVAEHLRTCPDCLAEARTIEKSWEVLRELDEIKPAPQYIARFWRALDTQMPWYEKILRDVQTVFLQRRWVPVLAGAAVIVFVGGIVTLQFFQRPETVSFLAELNATELEMVVNFELAEDYEIIKDIDFFSDLEVIENLDGFEIS